MTRTGRVLINFKMTDYTSSFSMQKWVKNEEEAQKFDIIKKNSWLRVRGNVEMNNFTRDLTMNVQDVQEVVHYERKDLMPEDERRVEFHAHTNMSTMDALPEVEEIVATAASGDTRRLPSRTMGMSSPSHMATRQLRKLEFS